MKKASSSVIGDDFIQVARAKGLGVVLEYFLRACAVIALLLNSGSSTTYPTVPGGNQASPAMQHGRFLTYPQHEVAGPTCEWFIQGDRAEVAMADHEKMRASDADRQEVIQRLRTALDEGRLKMDEYLDRMGHASEAVTYGDLTPLYADLPETSPMIRPGPVVPARVPAAAGPARGRAGHVRRAARSAQSPVDPLGGRRVGQPGGLGPGLRHHQSADLSVAALGGRPVGRRAARPLGWQPWFFFFFFFARQASRAIPRPHPEGRLPPRAPEA